MADEEVVEESLKKKHHPKQKDPQKGFLPKGVLQIENPVFDLSNA